MKRRIAALYNHLCRNTGQCSSCGGIFPDWNGGTCAACQATGRT